MMEFLFSETILQKFWKYNEHDTLKDLVEIYIKSGDTDYSIPGIIQRALNLPILTEKEINEKINKV